MLEATPSHGFTPGELCRYLKSSMSRAGNVCSCRHYGISINDHDRPWNKNTIDFPWKSGWKKNIKAGSRCQQVSMLHLLSFLGYGNVGEGCKEKIFYSW